MNQQRDELSQDTWQDFFDTVTKDHAASDATIEVLGVDLGDQVEAEKIPLAYVEYDAKDDDFTVGVGGRDGRYPVVLDHIIEHPQRILVDTLTPQAVRAVEVFGKDGGHTIVTLHQRTALR